MIFASVKALRLHYGKIYLKLMSFKERKKYFTFLKPTNLTVILASSNQVWNKEIKNF